MSTDRTWTDQAPQTAVNLRRVGILAIGIAWVFVVLTAYYVVHKPFSADSLIRVTSIIGDLCVAFMVYIVGVALGRRMLVRIDFGSALEAITFEAAVGLGVVAILVFGLGLSGLLDRWLLWSWLAVALFFLRKDVTAVWRQIRQITLPVASTFERLLMIFAGLALGLAFVGALTPTIAWDAQVYHLVIGKTALARGAITASPENPPLNFPPLVEMLFLAGMALKSDGAGPLVHWGFALLLSGAIFSFGRRYFSSGVAWTAVALLCAVPSLMLTATWAYNDLALAFYSFTSLYALLIAKEKGNVGWFVLSGACAGFAMGEKYMAVAVPLALLLVALIIHRPSLKSLIVLGGACVLVAAPWYLRNWAQLGSPIYPLLTSNGYWDGYRAAQLQPPSDLINHPLRLLTLPWDLTVLGVQGTVSFDATVGPFFLILIPLLFLVWRRDDRITQAVLIFCAALYGVWLVELLQSSISLQTRYLFFVFPAFAMLAANAFNRLSGLDLAAFSFARFARLVLLVGLAMTLWDQWGTLAQLNPFSFLIGVESREEFISKRLQPAGYYAALKYVDQLPAHSKVLFLWEPRDYYVSEQVKTQSDWILDQFGHLRNLYWDSDGIDAALRSQGFTHILVNRWGLDYQLANRARDVDSNMVKLLQGLLNQHARQVWGTLPLEWAQDGSGNDHIVGAEMEAYSIYALQ